MGAAASNEAAPAADDLAASLESWVTSGGERCAAAIAALEAAAPTLATALRSADADAVRGALTAAPAAADAAEANADTADSAPATKRQKPSANSGDAFVRVVLQKAFNASKVLNFAGYRTVLRLEEVCRPARTALRAAKLELDVSKEKNALLALKHAQRQELLDARRKPYFPPKGGISVTWSCKDDGVQQSTADVLYRDDRVLLTSPRPPQLFSAASGLDARDQERSKASLAAHECSRASLLAVGCVLFNIDHRRGNLDEAGTRNGFWRTIDDMPSDSRGLLVGEAQASVLVEPIGGARSIPRRLVLAAGRAPPSLGGASRAALDRAFLFSADKSTVLGVDQLLRLASAAWRAKGVRRWGDITEEVFLGACADAHISDSDATVAWREACSGVLLPFTPAVRGLQINPLREPGDVQPGDEAIVDFSSWLLPAVTGVALTMITNGVYRDPASCLSAKDCYVYALTFESLVLRMETERCDAICIFNELAFRRNGEDDDEPGRARVAEAVASLLTPDRVATIAVGSAVECGAGQPLTWVSASVVELAMETMIATIRVEGEEETKVVGVGALRLVKAKPSAAAIMLAHAVQAHKNDLVVQILASPLMAAPLSFVVGKPGQNIALRCDARATALDHAISSRNAVAVGLLQRNYVKRWDVWSSCLSTHGTSDVKYRSMPPRVRSDLYCALRLAPASFRTHLNAWRPLLELGGVLFDKVADDLLSGDMARVRALVRTVTQTNMKTALELLLVFAAKLGRVDVISELLQMICLQEL